VIFLKLHSVVEIIYPNANSDLESTSVKKRKKKQKKRKVKKRKEKQKKAKRKRKDFWLLVMRCFRACRISVWMLVV